MNLICSFLPEFPFNAGDEVDVLDGQDMWCPAYILYIDFRDSRVLIGQKHFTDVHDEWLPMSRIMPSNTRRFINGQEPQLNQMVKFHKGYNTYIGKIKKKVFSLQLYRVEYINKYNNRKEIELSRHEVEEAHSCNNVTRYLAIKGQVKIYSSYSEEQLNGLRLRPCKKYFRKRF